MNMQKDLNAILRTDFDLFMQRVVSTINPGTEFLDNWHSKAICYQLYRCWRGDINRLIITVPPRYGKSICSSIALPAWILGHDPTQRIITSSYGSTLSAELSSNTRKVMKSPWYGDAFPGTIIDSTKDTEEYFRTTKGGYRYATSIGGSVTGLGGLWLIIDDPMKASPLPSENELKSVLDYYSGTLYSRLDNKKEGRVILIMQRLHEDDLVGNLLEQEGWTHLNLPAIAEEPQVIHTSDEEEYERAIGEPLHPERESNEELKKIKKQLGPYAFAAQYQQNPSPTGGGIIHWDWFRRYKHLPQNGKGGFITQSWDTALSTHESRSYSVCTTWFCYEGKYYLMDVWRQRLEHPDLLAFIPQHAMQFSADLVVIELNNCSEALITMLRRHTKLNLAWHTPKGSKAERMIAETPALAARRVYIPESAEWLTAFRNEMVRFPAGKYDDQVDSLSQFLFWTRVAGPEKPRGGGVPGFGKPYGPMGPEPQSHVYVIEPDPPDLDFSELY